MGPGRCGTTFLWSLFKELGYDTGEETEFLRAKAEDIRAGTAVFPRVVKGTGGLCLNFRKHMQGHEIEHVFLCIRTREVLLRRHIEAKQGHGQYKKLTQEELEARLTDELPHTVGSALLHAIEHPYSIVRFPKSAEDPEYMYTILYRAGFAPDRDRFMRAWQVTVKPELIRFPDPA